MAEVLSQSQIDALLASVLGGNEVQEEASEEKGKKFRNYDFHSPKKFTKDKLNIIQSVYENYCRMATSRINSLLRVTGEVSLVAVEEERYYEFSNALSDNDTLTLVDAKVSGQEDGLGVFMHISTPLMLSMIDRMLGGSGEESLNVPSSYVYTEIDLMLYENIAKYLVAIMKDGWSNYLGLEFEISRLDTTQGLIQEIGMDEIVVIVVIEVNLNDIAGKMNICIPSTLLTDVFSIIESKKVHHSKSVANEDKTSQEIFKTIKSSSLEVTAKMGNSKVFLKDIYNLNEGDVINMNILKNSDVDIFIENTPWFKGKLGVHNKNMAVRISGINKN